MRNNCSQEAIINELLKSNKLNIRELSDAIGLTRQAIGSVLNTLESNGYVYQLSGYKQKTYSLTGRGRSIALNENVESYTPKILIYLNIFKPRVDSYGVLTEHHPRQLDGFRIYTKRF